MYPNPLKNSETLCKWMLHIVHRSYERTYDRRDRINKIVKFVLLMVTYK